MFKFLHCSTVHCTAVQVHYSAGLSSAVDYSLLQCGSVGSCRVQCSVVQHLADQQNILSKREIFYENMVGRSGIS